MKPFFIKRIVNSIFGSNTFVIYNLLNEQFWIIDPGDVNDVLILSDSIGKKVFGVLLTHTHFDHIYGLNKLLEHNPDLIVYVGKEDRDALFSSKMNMSKYHEEGEFIFNGSNVVSVSEGELISLFDDIDAKVIEVPGHTPGCIAYKIEDYLFTGDAYIPGHDVVTLLPRANKIKAKDSWERINEMLKSENVKLFPGHGEIDL